MTTVGINVDKVKAALGSMPMPDNAWDLLFKPEYVVQAEVLCGVSFLDSATEVVPSRAALPGQAAVQQDPVRLCGGSFFVEVDPAAHHAVQFVGLHQ